MLPADDLLSPISPGELEWRSLSSALSLLSLGEFSRGGFHLANI